MAQTAPVAAGTQSSRHGKHLKVFVRSERRTAFSGCGGSSILSAAVKKVNLPNRTQLWVTIDFKPVGTITLKHGSGSMTPYNLGDFGVSMDQVRIFNSLPDTSPFQQFLSGSSFS